MILVFKKSLLGAIELKYLSNSVSRFSLNNIAIETEALNIDTLIMTFREHIH